jgi:hypothetical protein
METKHNLPVTKDMLHAIGEIFPGISRVCRVDHILLRRHT